MGEWMDGWMEGRRTGGGGEDYEAGPVVFDEFAHFVEVL